MQKKIKKKMVEVVASGKENRVDAEWRRGRIAFHHITF